MLFIVKIIFGKGRALLKLRSSLVENTKQSKNYNFSQGGVGMSYLAVSGIKTSSMI